MLGDTSLLLEIIIVTHVGEQVLTPEIRWASKHGSLHAFKVHVHLSHVATKLRIKLEDVEAAYPAVFRAAEQLAQFSTESTAISLHDAAKEKLTQHLGVRR